MGKQQNSSHKSYLAKRGAGMKCLDNSWNGKKIQHEINLSITQDCDWIIDRKHEAINHRLNVLMRTILGEYWPAADIGWVDPESELRRQSQIFVGEPAVKSRLHEYRIDRFRFVDSYAPIRLPLCWIFQIPVVLELLTENRGQVSGELRNLLRRQLLVFHDESGEEYDCGGDFFSHLSLNCLRAVLLRWWRAVSGGRAAALILFFFCNFFASFLLRRDVLQACFAVGIPAGHSHTPTDNVTEMWSLTNTYGQCNRDVVTHTHLRTM